MGCSGGGSKKSETQIKSADIVKTVVVEVSINGMTCTGCEQTIQSGITGIDGVKQVKATFTDGKAFVEFDPQLADTVEIKQKISDSGYIVTAIRPVLKDSVDTKF